MKKSVKLLGVLSLLLLLFLTTNQGLAGTTIWGVKVGSKNTYTYTKYLLMGKAESSMSVMKSETETENITVKEGYKFTITVSTIPDDSDQATGVFKYEEFTTEEISLQGYLMKVAENKSEYEEAAKNYGHISYDGKYMIVRISMVISGYNTTAIKKWDVNTGWLSYSLDRVSLESNGTVLTEIELDGGSSSGGAPGFEFITLMMTFVGVIVLVRTSKRIRK